MTTKAKGLPIESGQPFLRATKKNLKSEIDYIMLGLAFRLFHL
jgi:hypothetical protein